MNGSSGDAAATPAAMVRLLDLLPDALIVIDERQRVTYANGEAVRRFASGAEEVAGLDLVRLIRHPEALRAVDRVVAGQTRAQASFEVYRPVQAAMTLTAYRLDDGRQIALHLRDTGAEREAERMRSDFVANVSHELRSPLTTLSGLIETLSGPARDDAAARERFLPMMAQEARRMDRLIGDLLSLTRVESNERVRPETPVDLTELVRRIGDMLRRQAEAADLALLVDVPAHPLQVPGDEDQITQVIINLVENALRYGADGKRVELTLERTGPVPGFRTPVAIVRVRDFGRGIAAEHVPRLQERFYRVDPGRSRDKGGTGLGLAIVKHIVNRHRGRVRIASRPGEGASFEVLLPTA